MGSKGRKNVKKPKQAKDQKEQKEQVLSSGNGEKVNESMLH